MLQKIWGLLSLLSIGGAMTNSELELTKNVKEKQRFKSCKIAIH